MFLTGIFYAIPKNTKLLVAATMVIVVYAFRLTHRYNLHVAMILLLYQKTVYHVNCHSLKYIKATA